MGIVARVFKEESSDYMHSLSFGTFLKMILVGAVTGILTWGLALAIDKLMLEPIFCGETSSNVSICAHSTTLGNYVAMILVGIMTVPMLIISGIRRPLLVVIAAIASLWGVAVWAGGSWVTSVIGATAAYAAVYAATIWINRIRGNIAAVLFLTVFVVLARVVLTV